MLPSKISITANLPAVMVIREISCFPANWFGPSSTVSCSPPRPKVCRTNTRAMSIRGIGKACYPQRVTETEALHELRVDIDFGAVPRAIADERGGAGRVLNLT